MRFSAKTALGVFLPLRCHDNLSSTHTARVYARILYSVHAYKLLLDYARIRSCPHCHQPIAALSLIVNTNEKMDSERVVEAVCVV